MNRWTNWSAVLCGMQPMIGQENRLDKLRGVAATAEAKASAE
jgi:hypothetical protein